MNFNELITQKLNQHRGKFANVIFTKKDGSERSMNFMQGAKKGLRNGLWANGTVEKPSDLMLVSDLKLYRKFNHDDNCQPAEVFKNIDEAKAIFQSKPGCICDNRFVWVNEQGVAIWYRAASLSIDGFIGQISDKG